MSADLLSRLDSLIASVGLHGALDVAEPVSVAPLLDSVVSVFRPLPGKVNAFRMELPLRTRTVTRVIYNERLRHPDRTALLRYVQAHEFAHDFCGHHGSLFSMWGDRLGQDSVGNADLDYMVRGYQEAEADRVAAYLLVRREALRAMRGEGAEYIARRLDVPAGLVVIRSRLVTDVGR